MTPFSVTQDRLRQIAFGQPAAEFTRSASGHFADQPAISEVGQWAEARLPIPKLTWIRMDSPCNVGHCAVDLVGSLSDN